MSVAYFRSVGRHLWNECNYPSSAGFQPRSPFHEEPINPPSAVSLCVCLCHRGGTVLELDMTYICSPSCYGWAGIQVDTHRRCHPSVFPYRCARSRDSCPCRWVPPLRLLIELWRKHKQGKMTVFVKRVWKYQTASFSVFELTQTQRGWLSRSREV